MVIETQIIQTGIRQESLISRRKFQTKLPDDKPDTLIEEGNSQGIGFLNVSIYILKLLDFQIQISLTKVYLCTTIVTTTRATVRLLLGVTTTGLVISLLLSISTRGSISVGLTSVCCWCGAIT